MYFSTFNDTICALSTAQGIASIGVIRISGNDAFIITEKIFSKKLVDKKSHTVYFGTIKNNTHIIDEVVVTIFKNPASFTGENIVEIACHGSLYICNKILELLIESGCRIAKPGEFSMRSYLNKKMDLSQAEAIADLINSTSQASHKLAMHQMRGGFSKEISILREELIHFASMLELELDFSEEDVEFADRKNLVLLINKIIEKVKSLAQSFSDGNIIKNGIPVAIIGAPNAGKSTLLNVLLNDERAIVSEIAGTTRDTIEEIININGINYRYIDTAGIRETQETIEKKGIEKSFEKIRVAKIIILLLDAKEIVDNTFETLLQQINNEIDANNQKVLIVGNKIDVILKEELFLIEQKIKNETNWLLISAKNKINIDTLKNKLAELVNIDISENSLIVTNARHYEALVNTNLSLDDALTALQNNITTDFLTLDIRKALFHLGEITGQITNDDLLGNIFSKFCIGK
jgi:tRNA modification GTPase